MIIKKTRTRIFFVQTLYLYFFSGDSDIDCQAETVEKFFDDTFDDQKKKDVDQKFFNDLKAAFMENEPGIIEIVKRSAPMWEFESLPLLDRALLCASITELLFSNAETPYKVVVDEFVEIAKLVKGEDAGKFINGVLATVIKEREISD